VQILKRVLLSFIFVSSTVILFGQSEIEWMINKAIRLTEYKEERELAPVIDQLSVSFGQQNFPENENISQKKINDQLANIKTLITNSVGSNISFKEIGDALYKIKYELALVKLRTIEKYNDEEFHQSQSSIISNIESLAASAAALEINNDAETGYLQALNYFNGVKIGMLKNKKLKKGRNILSDVIRTASSSSITR